MVINRSLPEAAVLTTCKVLGSTVDSVCQRLQCTDICRPKIQQLSDFLLYASWQWHSDFKNTVIYIKNNFWNTMFIIGDTMCLRPCKLTISSYLFARWHLFRHIGYLRHQQQVDLWPFDLDSDVRVTCDVANFSHPKPFCSRVRPDVRDTSDVRQIASLNASALWGRRHNNDTQCM